MKSMLIGASMLATFALPAAALAATYQYVNTSGQIMTETAVNEQAALTAPDIAAHSGVILIEDTDTMMTTGTTVSNPNAGAM